MRFASVLLAVIGVSGGGCSQSSAPSHPSTMGASLATPEAAAATSSTRSDGCPAIAPPDRTRCTQLLAKCSYPAEPRCPFAHCADVASQLVWITSYDHCPLACPSTKPTAGTACSPVTSQACEYAGGSKCGYRMRCTPSGWAEEELTLCAGM